MNLDRLKGLENYHVFVLLTKEIVKVRNVQIFKILLIMPQYPPFSRSGGSDFFTPADYMVPRTPEMLLVSLSNNRRSVKMSFDCNKLITHTPTTQQQCYFTLCASICRDI